MMLHVPLGRSASHCVWASLERCNLCIMIILVANLSYNRFGYCIFHVSHCITFNLILFNAFSLASIISYLISVIAYHLFVNHTSFICSHAYIKWGHFVYIAKHHHKNGLQKGIKSVFFVGIMFRFPTKTNSCRRPIFPSLVYICISYRIKPNIWKMRRKKN